MTDENLTTDLRRSQGRLTEDSERSRSKVDASPFLLPRQFGRYELLMELAAGGMASLYLARLRGPECFEKQVAIKIIHPHLTRDAKFVRMFLDEARIAAQIHHPNVTQIFELGEVDGSYFMAMEYVHGQDFRAVLKANARRRRESGPSARDHWHYAAAILADAAAGLHSAHELRSPQGESLGIVHRDVSPHNLLVSYDGHVKLTDFGIAYARHRLSHTDSGTVKGKIAYMSPEHARGDPVDRRADIFSLGVVLWEAVCLRRLFRRETDTATLLEITQGDVPRPRAVRPDLPPELEEIAMRALARDPRDRYRTAQEMEQDLRRLQARGEPMVGAPEIAAAMEELFKESRAAREQAIRAALEAPTAGSPAAPGLQAVVEPSRETRLSAEVQAAVREPGRARHLGLGVLVVLCLGLGIGGYLLLRTGARPSPSAPDRPASVSPGRARTGEAPAADPSRAGRGGGAAQEGTRLLVTFEVTPATVEATIRFRGKTYRQSRLELLLDPGRETEPVRVEAPGFAPLERFVTVQAGATLSHTLALVPLPRRGPAVRISPRRGGGVGPVDIGLDD